MSIAVQTLLISVLLCLDPISKNKTSSLEVLSEPSNVNIYMFVVYIGFFDKGISTFVGYQMLAEPF